MRNVCRKDLSRGGNRDLRGRVCQCGERCDLALRHVGELDSRTAHWTGPGNACQTRRHCQANLSHWTAKRYCPADYSFSKDVCGKFTSSSILQKGKLISRKTPTIRRPFASMRSLLLESLILAQGSNQGIQSSQRGGRVYLFRSGSALE